MKVGIILSGHGHFATGLGSSLDLIMGIPGNLVMIDFPDGDNIVHLEQQFDDAIAGFNNADIIILVDLFSGSPFNVGMRKAACNSHIHLYYGINLGMLMELVSRSSFADSVEEIIAGIVDTGKKQIGVFEPSDLSNEDELCEDEDL